MASGLGVCDFTLVGDFKIRYCMDRMFIEILEGIGFLILRGGVRGAGHCLGGHLLYRSI